MLWKPCVDHLWILHHLLITIIICCFNLFRLYRIIIIIWLNWLLPISLSIARWLSLRCVHWHSILLRSFEEVGGTDKWRCAVWTYWYWGLLSLLRDLSLIRFGVKLHFGRDMDWAGGDIGVALIVERIFSLNCAWIWFLCQQGRSNIVLCSMSWIKWILHLILSLFFWTKIIASIRLLFGLEILFNNFSWFHINSI